MTAPGMARMVPTLQVCVHKSNDVIIISTIMLQYVTQREEGMGGGGGGHPRISPPQDLILSGSLVATFHLFGSLVPRLSP